MHYESEKRKDIKTTTIVTVPPVILVIYLTCKLYRSSCVNLSVRNCAAAVSSVTGWEGRLGSETGMDVRMAGASGRSAVSKASCAAVKQQRAHILPERSSEQPGRSIHDSRNCKYRKRRQEARLRQVGCRKTEQHVKSGVRSLFLFFFF